MSDKRYLIREHGYGYDDECFYVAGSSIHTVHDDRETAERELKRLELRFLRSDDLLREHANFWNSDPARMARADRFVFERTGEHLFSNWKEIEEAGAAGRDIGCGDDATLPGGMSDDDVLAFGRIAEVGGHELIELDDGASLHVLWDPREDEPVVDHDESGEYLVYAESREAAMAVADERTSDYGWDDVSLDGSAEDLSESPALLDRLVDTTPGLSWKRSGKGLSLGRSDDPKVVNALNALLRVPLFEIREIDPSSLMAIEEAARY